MINGKEFPYEACVVSPKQKEFYENDKPRTIIPTSRKISGCFWLIPLGFWEIENDIFYIPWFKIIEESMTHFSEPWKYFIEFGTKFYHGGKVVEISDDLMVVKSMRI